MNSNSSKTSRNRFGLLQLSALAAVVVVLILSFWGIRSNQKQKAYTSNGYSMSTIVSQTAYGPGAQKAMQQVNQMLSEYEKRLTLFGGEGDIARINQASGKQQGAEVSLETAELLQQALQLSQESDQAFAITIAPLTLAWGISGEHPRVVPQQELDTLLPLVDDSAVRIDLLDGSARVILPLKGMGIDLGGIAKGAACRLAAEIYEKNQVESAWLSIGGNVYARGTKPGGEPFRIGFRDPQKSDESYIASFQMTDKVIAVSGGYERFFEQDGKRYIHILNPMTGVPAESDLVSVGVIHPDGAVADFYSTTLFVLGKQKALEYMLAGGEVLFLDSQNKLYVSESLRDGFELYQPESSQQPNYQLIYIAPETEES